MVRLKITYLTIRLVLNSMFDNNARALAEERGLQFFLIIFFLVWRGVLNFFKVFFRILKIPKVKKIFTKMFKKKMDFLIIKKSFKKKIDFPPYPLYKKHSPELKWWQLCNN